MLVLITYDVETMTPNGQRRLRRVARACLDYGQRVQNSVFECVLNPAELVLLKARLQGCIDPERDSIRFYNLGNKSRTHVDYIGKQTAYDVESELII